MDNYTREGRGVRMQGQIASRQLGIDLNSDFSLPDYLPEIKRLLRVDAVVSPADKFIGVGNADFSGTVDFCILYAGNDGSLYSASHTEEYRFSIPVEMTSEFELGDGVTCDTEVNAETATGRVSAPRKLSLRCRLRADVRIYGTHLIEEQIDSDGSPLERLCGECECAHVFTGIGDPLVLEEEIPFDPQWADLRVIAADGKVFVSEASAASGYVSCRGEVYLKLTYCHETSPGAPTVQVRKLPFSQAIPVDGCEVNCEVGAHGVCSDLHVTVEEERILCEMTVRLQARAERNETVCFTRDLFSTTLEGENRYAELPLPHSLRCTNGNFSLNHSTNAEEAGLRSGMSIWDVSMHPSVTSLESERGKFYLLGKCRCHLILSDGDELHTQELEIPFRYELGGANATVTDYTAWAEAISCRARMDGDRLSLDAELAVCIAARGTRTERILTEAHFGAPVCRPSSVYTVCYPAKSDTLWSVAKRYHRPISAIIDRNALQSSASAASPDSLAGISYLLV